MFSHCSIVNAFEKIKINKSNLKGEKFLSGFLLWKAWVKMVYWRVWLEGARKESDRRKQCKNIKEMKKKIFSKQRKVKKEITR